jgi:3-oxoacyl-[acyl-carrier-protein] synthase II
VTGPFDGGPSPFDVVVTGMGVVCAVAGDDDELTEALRKGVVGLRPTRVGHSERVWVAGAITGDLPDEDPVWPGQELTRHERLAIVAARQATASASLAATSGPGPDGAVGVYVAACQGGLTAHGPSSSAGSPPEAPTTQSLSSLADTVALALGLAGPRVVTSNACSASASAIAVAAEELMAGRTRAAVVGGADALERFTLEGFGALASLDPRGCSPYHRSAGLSVGEGAGFLVLERAGAAHDRGARLRGRLLGWGASADAYHPTTPDPTGRGAATAVERALAMAACRPGDIDYISGHGTGTVSNDSMELRAFSSVFGECECRPRLSSTKSMIGHTLGAASVIESIAALLGMENGFYPPTAVGDGATPLHLTGCAPFDLVPAEAAPGRPRCSVKTSYAFGGANYALVWGHRDGGPEPSPAPPGPRRAVVVTGLGLFGPAGASVDEWADVVRCGVDVLRPLPVQLRDGRRRRVLVGLCPDVGDRRPATLNAWRRMDRLSRRCVVTAHDALGDAGVGPGDARRESTMILLASGVGPLTTLLDYRAQMANPDQGRLATLFPNTALNAAAGHVAAALGLRGGIASFTSGGLTSDLALRHGADLIESGRCEQVLVIAAEELNRNFVELVAASEVVRLAEARVEPFAAEGSGIALSETVVCLLLESEASARRRGIRAYGAYLGSGLAGGVGHPTSEDWSAAFSLATAASAQGLADVDVTYAAAGGFGERDQGERHALAALPATARVVPLKAFLGDALGASGAVGGVAALLGCRSGPGGPAGPRHLALVNSASMSGQCCTTAWGSIDERWWST